MNHYEILFIVHPDQSDQVPPLVEKYKGMLTQNGGTIHREEDWGRRKLAFPINKVHKGHYVLLNVECDAAEVDEMAEAFRFNDAILRHMVVRKEHAETEPTQIYKSQKEKDKGSGGGERSERPEPSEEKPEATPESPESPESAEATE
ncbi:30S ribosomal protein S6 [Thiohalorhabdus denitrificans]|uniref:Small ribosomal subunit protein bS6 n=1 Tax=Thiohalorhabdus denitrificans TaxID=381306 RepID=A0A0P9CU44_9GAMM|nr:30S ribosomal protein S6 [Thiohalorhabdus denitrificans]KPV40185.1 30S ribosomal protein S6 [Thiohalorhabdus denitrificans]SCX85347.1 small subunit ribosomal protein S6 [Thiohalorhabdus denitrificans]